MTLYWNNPLLTTLIEILAKRPLASHIQTEKYINEMNENGFIARSKIRGLLSNVV